MCTVSVTRYSSVLHHRTGDSKSRKYFSKTKIRFLFLPFPAVGNRLAVKNVQETLRQRRFLAKRRDCLIFDFLPELDDRPECFNRILRGLSNAFQKKFEPLGQIVMRAHPVEVVVVQGFVFIEKSGQVQCGFRNQAAADQIS